MRKLAFSLLVALGVTSAVTGPGCASDGNGDETTSGGGSIPLEKRITPAPGGARRLLSRQYIGAVRAVLGEKAAMAAHPPTDLPLHGFSSIGAAELSLSASDVEAYEASARDIAKAFVGDLATRSKVLPCEPLSPGDGPCLSLIAKTLGRRLWRRGLEDSEALAVSAVSTNAGSVYASVDKALTYLLLPLLQAPDFLYLAEVGEADPVEADRRALTPTELATRIAFFLTDAPPDDALLDTADKGGLADEAGLRAAATALLDRAEARGALGAFYDEVFRFDLIESTAKNAEAFPEWTPALQRSIHASVRAFLDDLVWQQNGDARTMLTADYAFVDSNLAPLYGVSVPPDAGLVKVTLPEEQQRMGLLGSAAFLSVFSHAAMTSPTKRGVFIRRTLLCDIVPPPPAAVVPKLPEDPTDGLSKKELLAQHMKDDNCRACHGLFDSLGWSLEKFDAIGRYRTEDKGKPVDTTGESPLIGSFDGPRELATLLAGNEQVPSCMVRNLFRNSMGHLETNGEEPAISDLAARFADDGYKVKDLLIEVVASPAFRLVGEPK